MSRGFRIAFSFLFLAAPRVALGQGWSLAQNEPNPFCAGGTKIYFGVEQTAHILLVVELPGCGADTLVDAVMVPGQRLVHWNGRDPMGRLLPRGDYAYSLTAGDEPVLFTDTRIMTVGCPAPPVLLVPGICGSSGSWDPFAQVLTSNGFVVDRFQLGPPTGYSLRPFAYVGALAAKLDAMGSDHVAVVAHSMGGLIAREYMRVQAASGRPNKISQLVTLGTPHHGSDLLATIVGLGQKVNLIASWVDPCIGNKFSRPALLDMLPGSWFLNRLNYGTRADLSDGPTSHGWSAHQPEIGLARGVYCAAIAGSGSLCNWELREHLWGKDASYHENDGTVSTGSALLSSSCVYRARDLDFPLATPATHSDNSTTACWVPYYSYADLAQRVASILSTSPPAKPLPAPGASPLPIATGAGPEDSLQAIPAITDSVAAGQLAERSVTVPVTSLLTFTLLSKDAHLSLRNPSGSIIAANDTSTAGGVRFFAAPVPGFEGFELAHPAPGTWVVRVDATASSGGQRFGCVVSHATSYSAGLSAAPQLIHPGGSIRVSGRLADGGVPQTNVTWSCLMLGPDSSTSFVTLYDDGAHGDSLAGDGNFENVFAPAAGVGWYDLTATATVAGGAAFVTATNFELADVQDLAIQMSDISLSSNAPLAGDSLTVFAVVHNNSTKAALGVDVRILDLRTGDVLGTSTVDIAAASALMVGAPWAAAAPDSHVLQVEVSPYVLDESDYANNTASRAIVLGEPVSVDPGVTSSQRLRFDLPRPNPTGGGVVLSFGVPRVASASLDILDMLGRRVRGWRWPSLPAGSHSVEWNGRGADGALLPAGVYLCRLDVDGVTFRRKLVLRR